MPDDTPLKRYRLLCPECKEEEVYLPAGSPEKPYCHNCEEEIDIKGLQHFMKEWMIYLNDRSAMLKKEGKKDE